MKIYVLLMLISAIVGFSYLSTRRLAKQPASTPPDSAAAYVQNSSGAATRV